MKNTIAELLLCFLLLFHSSALSQEAALAGLAIENERITGTAAARFAAGSDEALVEIKVDCPLPPDAYPSEILTIGKRSLSKKQMQSALIAAGQSARGEFVNPRGFASYTGDWSAEASANISKGEAAAQAIDVATRYFEALGVEIEPVPYSISRSYDYDAYMERQTTYYGHCFSDPTTFIEAAKSTWKQTSKHHPAQSEYTSLSFYILLNGMRLTSFTSYPAGYEDEPEAWIGFSVSANATVSDSGILVEASCPLYEIRKKRPLENDRVYVKFLQQLNMLHDRPVIPGQNWMNALSDYAGNLHALPCSETRPYQTQYMTEPIIQYGSKTVVTEIHPVLYTISEHEWAPFWSFKVKREFSDGWRD